MKNFFKYLTTAQVICLIWGAGQTLLAQNPVAVCKSITVQLDAAGTGSVTPFQIDGGSYAASGIYSITASRTTFDCSDLGPNTVLLTVTDLNLATSTCEATISVEDITPPVPDVSVIRWEQAAKILAAEGAGHKAFGWSVSVSGDYAIVGARMDDENGFNSGSAYIFHRNGNSWIQEAKLTAVDGLTGDEFGYSVSISGDYAVVGAPGRDLTLQDYPEEVSSAGSAYVFHRSGSTWTQQARLFQSFFPFVNARFGHSVSVSGGCAIVGEVNGSMSDDEPTGRATIFRYMGGSWIKEQDLYPRDLSYFGTAVSMDGDRAMVGAPDGAGGAYVFQYNGSEWIQETKLTAADGEPEDILGWSVAIHGDQAIAGSRGDDVKGLISGSAYLFGRTTNGWVQQAKLTADDGTEGDELGFSVALSRDVAIVGSMYDGVSRGSVYVFRRTGSSWLQQAKVTAPGGLTGHEFGYSAAISGDYLMVGAPGEGSAYFFYLPPEGGLPPLSSPCSLTPPAPTATDNCGSTLTGTTSTVFPVTSPGITTVTWTYTDGSGNSISQNQEIILKDATPPVPDLSVELGWAQAAKLLAADGDEEDYFGSSVSVSGEYAIAGAELDGEHGFASGAAYIFKRDGSSWMQQVKLNPNDRAGYEEFGASVSMSGDYVIVGAPGAGFGSGAAYVFHRVGSNWLQQAKLTATDSLPGNAFGYSVSIDSMHAVVGAMYDQSNGPSAGSVYIFHRSGNNWIPQPKLTPADGVGGDNFGRSVSVSGDYVIAGAPHAESSHGAAYVFQRMGGSWIQQAKLMAPDGMEWDQFGYSLSISGTHALIGAPGGDDSGAAYVYRCRGSVWEYQQKLNPAVGGNNDQFGSSVSISGDYALVAALYDDDKAWSAGAAYIFQHLDSNWVLQSKLTATDGEASDQFGKSVSISGTDAIVGAWWDDDQDLSAGAAYVFSLMPVDLPALTAACSLTPPAPTATDNCGGTIFGTTTSTFPITAPGTTTVTWTYDDGNGNTISQNQDIRIAPMKFYVVHVGTNRDLFELVDGAVISNMLGPISIRAEVEACGQVVNSVRFNLSGAQSRNQLENVAPWALAGDVHGRYSTWNKEPGSYSLTATPFSQTNGQGQPGTPYQIHFEVVNTPPPVLNLHTTPVTCNGETDGTAFVSIAGGTPPYQLSWSTGQLSQGNFNQAFLPALGVGNYWVVVWDRNYAFDTQSFSIMQPLPLSVTPTVTDASCPGCNDGRIDLAISGGTGAYEVGWDAGNGRYLTPGIYTATVRDINGCEATVSATVNARSTKFYVVSVATHQDLFELVNGGVISRTLGDVNIRAEVEGGGLTVESVRLRLTGASSRDQVENTAPWALAGDINGAFHRWNNQLGGYTLTATPFTLDNAQGQAGTAYTVNFTVISGNHLRLGAPDSVFRPAISVYPNPADQHATISFESLNDGMVDVQLLDKMGRIILQDTWEKTGTMVEGDLNLEGLAEGIYFVKIRQGDAILTERLVKVEVR